jgi:hypothetical protein
LQSAHAASAPGTAELLVAAGAEGLQVPVSLGHPISKASAHPRTETRIMSTSS